MEANVASELEIKEDESNLINLFLNIIDHLKEDDCNSINNSVEYQEAINAFADVIKEVPLVNITELLKQVFNLPEIKAKIEEAYKIKLNICRRKIGYDIYRQLQKILLEGEIQAIKKKSESEMRESEMRESEMREKEKILTNYKPVFTELQTEFGLGFTEMLVIPDPESEISRNELKIDDICYDIQKIKNNITTPNFFPCQFPLLTKKT